MIPLCYTRALPARKLVTWQPCPGLYIIQDPDCSRGPCKRPKTGTPCFPRGLNTGRVFALSQHYFGGGGCSIHRPGLVGTVRPPILHTTLHVESYPPRCDGCDPIAYVCISPAYRGLNPPPPWFCLTQQCLRLEAHRSAALQCLTKSRPRPQRGGAGYRNAALGYLTGCLRPSTPSQPTSPFLSMLTGSLGPSLVSLDLPPYLREGSILSVTVHLFPPAASPRQGHPPL